MYRPTELQTALYGVWGWRPHYDVSKLQLNSGLIASEFGQFYQDVHPLITLDNIRAIAPEFDGDTNDELFNTWLEQKTKASMMNAISTIIDEKMSEQAATGIMESKALFDGAGRLTDKIENTDSVVGLEIVPLRSEGVTTKIDRIGLQLFGIDQITMYLMHSSQQTPVKTINLTRTIFNGSNEWFTPDEDIYLPYISSDVDSGGSWYLVYNQNDFSFDTKAINKNKDWSKAPCSSCNNYEMQYWKVWSKYIEIHPFKVADFESALNDFGNNDFNDDFGGGDLGLQMWDQENNIYTYDHNYGINLQLTIECDPTDIIIKQRGSFQSVLGLQVAVDILREFAHNPEFHVSRKTNNTSMQAILYELDGDSQSYKKSGLVYKLDKAIEAIKVDLSDMSRACYRCKKRGLRYGTI